MTIINSNKKARLLILKEVYFPLVFISMVAWVGNSVTTGQFNPVQDKIVDIHNDYRRNVVYSAADMLKMYWDADMAALAEQTAGKCVFQHSDNTQFGENIYAASWSLNVGADYDPSQFLDSWGADERDEDMKRISQPSPGEEVGKGIYDHYSAMIWSSTVGVGCAYATGCSGGLQTIVVCNYNPAGNFVGKGWYIHGASCSKCPYSYTCENKLCVPSDNKSQSNPPSTPSLTQQPSLTDSPSIPIETSQSSTDLQPVSTPSSPHEKNPQAPYPPSSLNKRPWYIHWLRSRRSSHRFSHRFSHSHLRG